jgi:NAD(P)-dependent dehydrogenase (short-subunit alcohol dehydrogenase family)
VEKSVVITGSTSGIGLGLAGEFLTRHCTVTISGRSQSHLDQATAVLAEKFDRSHFQAVPCDVSQYDQVEGLWKAAQARFGRIDVWINNAGTAHPETPIWEYSPETIRVVVGSNFIGAFYGVIVAAKGMRQQGFGGIYNVEGLGSGGPIVKGLALYAATKSALAYLTKAAAREVEETPILVGGLRPGMVATKLITGQYVGHAEEWKRSERIFNILSDRVETVVPWMVDRILANRTNGVTIKWLTGRKIMFRFIGSVFHKRTIYD